MDRPSEPLLVFLREFIRRKGLNTAEVALRLGIDRPSLRRRLAGEEPLTVDDLILLSRMLEIRPEDMAGVPLPSVETAPATPARPQLHLIDPQQPPGEDWTPDPTGNLSMQALKHGFALGLDMFLIFDSQELDDSGIPDSILSQFKEKLPIDLPARYHRHNRPRFEEDGFECVLSFDRLCTCFFPWHAFLQLQFKLPRDVPRKAPPPAPPPAPSPIGKPGSHLRIVK